MSDDDGNFFSNIKCAEEAAKAQDDAEDTMTDGAKMDAKMSVKKGAKTGAKKGAKSGVKSSLKMVGQDDAETDTKSDTKTPGKRKPKDNIATAKENKQKPAAKDAKHKKGAGSKSGVLNRQNMGASDDEIAELDAKTIEDMSVVPTKSS
jgi:hypothetical protein